MSSFTQSRRTSGETHGIALLGALVFGHAWVHLFTSSFPILLAELVEDLGFGPIAAGAIMTFRLLVGGISNIPLGFVSDSFVSKQRLLLSFSFVWFGASYFLMSVAPGYALLLIFAGLFDIASALWHPPAMSTISRLFPRRRGFSIALHGVGASVGDIVGPLSLGVLIPLLTWQWTLRFTLAPAVVMTLAYLVLLRRISPDEESRRLSFAEYAFAVRSAIRYRRLLIYLTAVSCHSAAFIVLMTFFTIHVRSTLELGPEKAGFFLALMMGTSMASQPIMGLLSDRFNRTVVLLPAILILTVTAPVLGWVEGWTLVATVSVLGLFLFSSGTVLNATILDSAPSTLQATAIASAFTIGEIAGSIAPLIAGVIVHVSGTPGAFYLASALFAFSGAMVVMASLVRQTEVVSEESGG